MVETILFFWELIKYYIIVDQYYSGAVINITDSLFDLEKSTKGSRKKTWLHFVSLLMSNITGFILSLMRKNINTELC